jgi:hypothetical protein
MNLMNLMNLILVGLMYGINAVEMIHQGTICGPNPTKTFYISKQSDIDDISHCNVLNGSLYINGENNLVSLSGLSNLHCITGDLVITDSHNIMNLNGFDGLKHIEGHDLYLDQYSVLIKDNNNLAFTDTIDWVSLTNNTGLVSLYNNYIDSIDCDSSCDGCFAPSPYFCQECKYYHFLETNVCTNECDNNSSSCIPREPQNMTLNVSNRNATCVNISWETTDIYSNLINSIYIVNENSSEIMLMSSIIPGVGYHYNYENLTKEVEVCDLYPNSDYYFSLQVSNLFDNSSKVFGLVSTMDYSIPNITNFYNKKWDDNTLVLYWHSSIPPDTIFFKGTDEYFEIEIYHNGLLYHNKTHDTHYIFYHTLDNGDYLFRVREVYILSNKELTYYSEWYENSFYYEGSTTPSTSTSTSTTPDDYETIYIVIYILIGILLLLFSYYCFRKNNIDRNRTSASVDNSFANPSFTEQIVTEDAYIDIAENI